MIYFSERGVLLQDGFLEGPAGTFDLNHIVSVESKPSTVLLVAMGGIACLALLGAFSGHGSAVAIGLGVAAIFGAIFLYACVNQYVFVRTSSGVRSLGTEMSPRQRRLLMEAFVEAKGNLSAPKVAA